MMTRKPMKRIAVIFVTCFKATNEVVTRVPKCTSAEMQSAVDSAKEAFRTWSQTTVLTRQQLMMKLQAVIRRDMVRRSLLWNSIVAGRFSDCVVFFSRRTRLLKPQRCSENAQNLDADPESNPNRKLDVICISFLFVCLFYFVALLCH